jgi:hypothetical protein
MPPVHSGVVRERTNGATAFFTRSLDNLNDLIDEIQTALEAKNHRERTLVQLQEEFNSVDCV